MACWASSHAIPKCGYKNQAPTAKNAAASHSQFPENQVEDLFAIGFKGVRHQPSFLRMSSRQAPEDMSGSDPCDPYRGESLEASLPLHLTVFSLFRNH